MKYVLLMVFCLIGGCQFTFKSGPRKVTGEPALSVISDSDLATYNRVRRILNEKTEAEAGKYREGVYPVERSHDPAPGKSHLQQPGETYDQWYRRVGPIIGNG